MKKKHFASLWFMFAVLTFFVFLSVFAVVAVIAFTLSHMGYLAKFNDTPLIPIVALLFLSVIFGMVLFLFVGQVILKPVQRFSEAIKIVAKGDFSIELSNEKSRIKEVQDITQNFNLMVRELSSIETLRSDFVTNVSHEFKTPLAGIEGYASLLQDKSLPESERDECIKLIIDSSKQLSALTENILDLSRLENQEVVLDKKEFRIDEQIREAVLLLENKWTEKNIDLIVNLVKVKYVGNKNLLRQVWLNLLENAVKFTPENGCIEIHLLNIGDQITVKVKDNGRGMEQAEINHIFDKFYQVDRARKQTGNGLGLALVKRIIDLCGGSIEVQSELGKGSEFTVMLPNKSQD